MGTLQIHKIGGQINGMIWTTIFKQKWDVLVFGFLAISVFGL